MNLRNGAETVHAVKIEGAFLARQNAFVTLHIPRAECAASG
jgi:hypothetical protein